MRRGPTSSQLRSPVAAVPRPPSQDGGKWLCGPEEFGLSRPRSRPAALVAQLDAQIAFRQSEAVTTSVGLLPTPDTPPAAGLVDSLA